MSVLSYLQKKASDAILSSSENDSIRKSIVTLQTRLRIHFGTTIKIHFQFGSSTRGTILPRSMDDRSDIDYMIVFGETGYMPQTYLNRLKIFVEKYYSSSEIYQSNPSIVLVLNHIKFDLVPATQDLWLRLQIPNGTSQWQYTDPNDFNKKLIAVNNSNISLIKPTIRLIKYWNAENGYPYQSFSLEKWIIELSFWSCVNQKDYLFTVFDNLITNPENTQGLNNKIIRAKNIITNVRQYEMQGNFIGAELEVMKLIH